jgi:hypothetical protein
MKASENKLKIELEGPALGTLKWFEKFMSESKFIIKGNEEETPSIFLRHLEDDRLICKKKTEKSDERFYNISSNGCAYISPEYEGNKEGLFDFPLTPKCREAVENTINEAMTLFVNWWKES